MRSQALMGASAIVGLEDHAATAGAPLPGA